MAEEENKDARPLVERWLEDQQEWQKTMLRYMDSMANNEEFLQNLGNAMRGSLLAGKPYPGTEPVKSEAKDEPTADATQQPADDRLDRILFMLHEIQGQLNDLHLTVDRLTALVEGAQSAGPGPGTPDSGVPDDDASGDSAGDNAVDADPASGETESSSFRASMSARSGRGRFSRSADPVSAQPPKLRRSPPRSTFGRRGDTV